MGVNGGTPKGNTEDGLSELSGPLLKWFSALIFLFPIAHRRSVGLEILADLALRPTWSARSVVAESLALLRAGISIGIRTAYEQSPLTHIANGAAIWFGVLVTTGPLARLTLRQYQVDSLETKLGIFRPWTSLTAVVLFVVLVAVRRRFKVGTVAAMPVLLICAGLSTSQGRWTPSEAIAYETLWLGPSLAILALAVLQDRGGQHGLSGAAIAVTAALSLQPFDDQAPILVTAGEAFGGRLYSTGLAQLLSPPLAIAAIGTCFIIGILRPRFLLMATVPITQLVALAFV